jgi:hypothetical protein
VLRNKFGPKKEEVKGERNNCVWSFRICISDWMFEVDQVNEDEINKACGTNKKRNASKASLCQPERTKKDHSEELRGNGSVLLKWILME